MSELIWDIIFFLFTLWAIFVDLFLYLFIGSLILVLFLGVLESLGRQWKSDSAKLFDNIPGDEEKYDNQNRA